MTTLYKNNLPLTDGILSKTNASDPPALIREWQHALTTPGSYAILSMGMIQGGSDQDSRAWSSLSISDPSTAGINDTKAAEPVIWEKILTAIAAQPRVLILQSLFGAPKSAADLTRLTQLKGGALYYHLHTLLHAGMLEKRRKAYALSPLGLAMYMNMMTILKNVHYDPNGNLVDASW